MNKSEVTQFYHILFSKLYESEVKYFKSSALLYHIYIIGAFFKNS